MKVYARQTAAVVMVFALALWTGCGDVFRPVANPIPGPTTDPRNFHLAIVVSQNAAGNPGSGMQIDVSGDSNAGIVKAGQQPTFAAVLGSGIRVFVSNTDGTIATFIPAGLGTSIGAPTAISVPAGLIPGFLFSTETTTMYAATSGLASPPCTSSAVLAIDASNLSISDVMCVGLNPIVLTETPDKRKVYAVNSDGTVSSINTVDKSVNPPITAPSLTAPVWAVASVDNAQVFVLDATGVVWTVDTFTDQVSVPPNQTASPANFMALDRVHNRLYVTGAAGGNATVRILDANTATLTPLTAAPLSLPAGSTPFTVSFLPNGTRAYVLSSTTANASGVSAPIVSVINTANNSIFGTINLPSTVANPSAVTNCNSAPAHPFSMAAAGNSSRLYVTNCYAGTTSIIDTSTNRAISSMNSPVSAYSPMSGAKYPPPQNPVLVVAGP